VAHQAALLPAVEEVPGVAAGYADKFTPITKKVLAIGKAAIHASLKRTMGGILEATNGRFAESKFGSWMKARVIYLLSHNNTAERLFAVLMSLDYLYSLMRLPNSGHIRRARVN
jgi:hypothetical protein